MNYIFEIQDIIKMENNFIWLISNIIFNILFSIIDIFIFINFLNIKTTKKRIVLGIIINSIIKTISMSVFSFRIYRAINITVTILMFKTILKQNISKCILGEVSNAITVICTEAIFSKIYCILMPGIDTYQEGLYDLKFNILLKISMIISRIIICFLIKYFHLKIDITNINNNNQRTIAVVSLIGCFIIYCNSLEMSLFMTDFPYEIFALNTISIVIYFYISMSNIIRMTRIEEKDMLIDNLETYNRTISIMYDSLSSFKHDYSNFVQAINGYVDTNNMDGVRDMVKDMTKEYTKLKSLGELNPNYINNPAVYSILTNKYYLAGKNDIMPNIRLNADFSGITKYNYEFCKILGILLDNAIEAAKQTKEKILKINANNEYGTKNIKIVIENSYDNEINMEKLYDKGYTTKKEKGHGLGLWIAMKIVNKNKRMSLNTQKGKTFKQEFEMKVQ